MNKLLLLAGLFALPLHVQAAGAHVHGAGKLDVTIDKGTITLQLELPLDAAVGFEHAPKNDKEAAALVAAEKALDNSALFVPTPAANCTAQPARVAMPVFAGKQGGDVHADIDATHVFRCANPAALTTVETGIFKSFKRLYRLEVQRVGPAGQGAARLTPKNPVLAW
jgi:hypothetical protein